MRTFSTNAAAELMDRDPRTILVALRDIPADAIVKGREEWRLPTILTALESTNFTRQQREDGQTAELFQLFGVFDALYAKIEAVPTLEKRRALAIAMKPLIRKTNRMYREVSIANGAKDIDAHLRADAIYRITLRGFEELCGWTYEQTHKIFGDDVWGEPKHS